MEQAHQAMKLTLQMEYSMGHGGAVNAPYAEDELLADQHGALE